MVLGHIEAELSHVGARTMGVDADQVRLGLPQPAAFIAEDIRGSLRVRQCYRLVDDQHRPAVH